MLVFLGFRQYENLGQLTVSVSLEDWGVMNDMTSPSPVPAAAAVSSTSDVNAGVVAATAAASSGVTSEREPEARGTQEYAAALELEMWKEQQEAMFQSKVCGVHQLPVSTL